MSEERHTITLVELIDRLEPAPLPEPVLLLPQTQGWVILGVLLGAAAFFGLRHWLMVRARSAHRRAALAELGQCSGDPARIAAILRRTALASFPRAEVGSLHGAAWLRFLDQAYGGTGFQDGPGRVVAEAPYRRVGAEPGLDALAATWIRRHREREG